MSSIRTILAYGFPVEPINALQVATMEVMEWPTSRTAFHQLQARHPLMHRTSIGLPVRPSRLEESLQTPGGTVQRDLGLAATWGLRTADRAQRTRNWPCAGRSRRLCARIESASSAKKGEPSEALRLERRIETYREASSGRPLTRSLLFTFRSCQSMNTCTTAQEKAPPTQQVASLKALE